MYIDSVLHLWCCCACY